MKILFMGTPDFSVPVLEALARDGHEICGVITQPDRPVGRHKDPVAPPVKTAALAHGYRVFQPEKAGDVELLETLRSLGPELSVVVAYGQLLPAALLSLPKYGSINVHASLLPEYRGAAPIHQAILDGRTETGVSIMQMDEGLDTGAVLLKETVPIGPRETAGSLHDRLAEAGAGLAVQAVRQIEAGTAEAVPQEEERASYVHQLTKQMGEIDWRMPAVKIDRQIRGLDPWPGAYTFWDGKRLMLHAAEPEEQQPEAVPGTVLSTDPEGIRVAAGDGVLRITELKAEGKKRMCAADFLRGAHLHPGTVFGRKK